MTAGYSSSLPLTEERTLTKRSKTLTMPHLPFDLVSDILCKLCVKHLLQLCCVCKSWNSLISRDSNFARKQLCLSTSNKNRHHLIQSSSKSYREFLLSHSPISSLLASASIVPVKQLRHTLKRVLNNRGSGAKISTCDGILCFAINGSLAVLYNPFIRKFKKLPPLEAPKPRVFQNLYTLVYDRFTSNYKIIALTFGDSKNQVYIHTLGTDCWRRIQDFPCSQPVCTPGIFVNDTVNWLGYDDPYLPKAIVSLDLEKESYQKLSPPFSDMRFEIPMILGVLRGCLSIVSHRQEIPRLSNIWIMKEYGNEKSWIKLLSVPLIQECRLYSGLSNVLYISENDQLLMEFYRRDNRRLVVYLVVYDSTNNTFTIPKMQNNNHDLKVTSDFYVESLISPC